MIAWPNEQQFFSVTSCHASLIDIRFTHEGRCVFAHKKALVAGRSDRGKCCAFSQLYVEERFLVVVHSGGQKDCALIALWVDRQVGCGSHHPNRVHRNGIKLLRVGWKSPPSSDCKNYYDCGAAQDTHGRSPL